MPSPTPSRLSPEAAVRAVWALFALGLAIAVLMLIRSQVGGDQLNLLARGWLLAAKGIFIPYGNPLSTGGKAPGGITTVLVGLPLMLWRDHRAPSALVLLFHVAAYWLLDGTLKQHVAPRERVLLALFYWLNPWQLFFAAFLWNPNYLFLFGALHLWSALAQRQRARFWPSFLHAAGLAVAVQIHPSVLLLAVASLLLWLRRFFRIHWPGLIAGGAVASLPLIPWAIEVLSHPAIVTEAKKGFLGRGLIHGLPRGVAYWLRYASLSVSWRMDDFNFSEILGSFDRWLSPALHLLSATVLSLTVLVPLIANLRLWRVGPAHPAPPTRLGKLRAWGRAVWRHRLVPGTSPRSWLKGYVRICFVAGLIVFALSPTTVMMWQGLILFHAAILPVVLWIGPLTRTRFAARAIRWTRAYGVAEVVFLLAIAFGTPYYRCAGHKPEDSFNFNLRSDSPMFRELNIQQTCPWPMRVPGGWWPDVLPEGE
ncbi:MAG TPA: hypothetical protein VF173_15105 [Thermoanaerobaculia bacterium]|nr:hypothetical protein [Thermoanaerobaculia bacterium]